MREERGTGGDQQASSEAVLLSDKRILSKFILN